MKDLLLQSCLSGAVDASTTDASGLGFRRNPEIQSSFVIQAKDSFGNNRYNSGSNDGSGNDDFVIEHYRVSGWALKADDVVFGTPSTVSHAMTDD